MMLSSHWQFDAVEKIMDIQEYSKKFNAPYDKKQNGLVLCSVWLFWSSILSRWEWVMINHGFTKNRLKYTNGPKNYMGGSEIFWTLFFFFQIREILILAQAILKMNLFIRFGLLRNL